MSIDMQACGCSVARPADYGRQLMQNPLAYDGAPRPITADEAKAIAHAEYARSPSGVAMYRGADGGMHPFDPLRRGQDAIAYLNVKRADLRARIMSGECQHTVFYDRARDTFYCG